MIEIPKIAAELTERERGWLSFQRLASEGVGNGCIDQWAYTGGTLPRLKRLGLVEEHFKNHDSVCRLTFFGALVANEVLKTEWPTGFLRSYFEEPQKPRYEHVPLK